LRSTLFSRSPVTPSKRSPEGKEEKNSSSHIPKSPVTPSKERSPEHNEENFHTPLPRYRRRHAITPTTGERVAPYSLPNPAVDVATIPTTGERVASSSSLPRPVMVREVRESTRLQTKLSESAAKLSGPLPGRWNIVRSRFNSSGAMVILSDETNSPEQEMRNKLREDRRHTNYMSPGDVTVSETSATGSPSVLTTRTPGRRMLRPCAIPKIKIEDDKGRINFLRAYQTIESAQPKPLRKKKASNKTTKQKISAEDALFKKIKAIPPPPI